MLRPYRVPLVCCMRVVQGPPPKNPGPGKSKNFLKEEPVVVALYRVPAPFVPPNVFAPYRNPSEAATKPFLGCSPSILVGGENTVPSKLCKDVNTPSSVTLKSVPAPTGLNVPPSQVV